MNCVMSSETLFINRQKASWCVSKWWEAGDCSLYKWVQNMIKRNRGALRKNNACVVIILTRRTLAHSLVWSYSEPLPTLCGGFCTWCACGGGLWEILALLINSLIKAGGLYTLREVWQRGSTSLESWSGCASSCCLHGRDVLHAHIASKAVVGRAQEGCRQAVGSGREQQ